MGNKQTVFSDKQIEEYKKLTYLNGPEILHCFQKFKALDEERVLNDWNAALPKDSVLKLPELAVNPLRDRIIKVFSSHNDDTICFEDFLNMMSVFSESAPIAVKCCYAFEIFDFSDTNVLNRDDIQKLIKRLIGKSNNLSESDMELLVDKIFEEADIDENGEISLDEFEYVVSKSPEFASMTTPYAKRMAQLSARIFNEIRIKNPNTSNAHLSQRFQLKPIDKQVAYSANYYPRHQELDHLTLTLRDHGLYRDEHRDFNDEMERLRKLRGKGRKPRKKIELPPTITINENFKEA